MQCSVITCIFNTVILSVFPLSFMGKQETKIKFLTFIVHWHCKYIYIYIKDEVW